MPPLDVHWVWHTHMLSPRRYQTDCMALGGKVIDHKLWSPTEKEQHHKSSVQIWESKCPHEPFDFMAAQHKNYESRLSYNITAAVQRQRKFNSRILKLVRSARPNFVAHAIDQYKRFLYLQQLNPRQELSPSMEIDLVWHTHQVLYLTFFNS